MNARHLSRSVEHYTPSDLVEAARLVLGVIHLDPASCPLANETVRAARIFTREEDGLARPWSGRVFLNPPGGRDPAGSVQKQWWQRLAIAWDAGEITAAIFVAFSVELLQTSQVAARGLLPFDFPICVPSRRVAYQRSVEEVRTPQGALFDKWTPSAVGEVETGESPPHASFLVYLPPRLPLAESSAGLARFRAEFSKFGRVVGSGWWAGR
jgi:hypothetical protein